jgi:glycosyltransferase involved in cell wall biosynthesis
MGAALTARLSADDPEHIEGRVNAYWFRSPHFASHSGYELVVRGAAINRGIVGLGQTWPVRHAAVRHAVGTRGRWLERTIAERAQAAVSRLAGSSGYSTGGLALELSAIWKMGRSRGQIFHFLYGENTCRIAPAFNGWRGHTVLATFHQTPDQLRAGIRRPGYLRRLGAAIILGRTQAEFLGQFVPPEQLHLIPHGVDAAYFRPPPARRRHDPPRCVSVAGHLRDFGTLRLALDLLEMRGVPVQYDIIASWGEQLAYVRGLPRARIRARVDDAEFLRLYQQADVFVLPLRDAVASNTLLEAMACGAPTVVTDVGAVRDYVDDQCVALARPGDPRSLAEAIERCLRDTRYAQLLGAAARARALEFDLPVVAARHRQLYRALLNGS